MFFINKVTQHVCVDNNKHINTLYANATNKNLGYQIDFSRIYAVLG